MKFILTAKPFWLVLIIILLNIPLLMIESQIMDRSEQREIAKSLVSQSWTGAQEILGAFLVVPYEQKVQKEITSEVSFSKTASVQYEWVKKQLFIMPKSLSIDSDLKTQILQKGIYSVPVYTGVFSLTSSFQASEYVELKKRNDIRINKRPYISLGIKDTRGIVGAPQVSISNKEITVSAGSGLGFYPSGFKASKDFKLDNGGPFRVDIKLKLNGMESIHFMPSGDLNQIKLKSDWPHPNFNGAFLPQERSINSEGYSSRWETGVFSTNFAYKISECLKSRCQQLLSSGFGVTNIQPVDVYVQSLRSIKYGLLIILVTFGFFFLYEVLTQSMSIHPIAYALIGVALAIFFLLLVALSEHINFSLAYLIAALSCSSLIGFYIRHQSGELAKGVTIWSLLISVYAVLYFIIRSEDFAFLSGSLLSFGLLVAVIYVTRKIDWYQVFDSNDKKAKV